ncbi:MAG: histidine kinase [Parafilimonas terrae]|nr:histidine kinase [Parafilimonas terrae]
MENGTEERPVVLVAEPQALPGMWLEDVLKDAGCAVSGPYGTSSDATGSLDGTPPDFAIVSVDLIEGPCFPLACALRRRGIPFALIAGNARVPKAFADVPLFARLFDARDMVSAVTAGCAVPGCPRACPMLRRIAAGAEVALDQCPVACRA